MIASYPIQAFAQRTNTPLTAVSFRPVFDEKKRRVKKGDGLANRAWEKEPGYNPQHATEYFGVRNVKSWYFLMEKLGWYVIDVDVVGDDTAKDVLTDEMYNKLWDNCSYVVETGSNGLHFYFQRGEGVITKKTDVEEFRHWFKDGKEGAIDIITQFIVAEGSSYEFQGKTYRYKAVKGSLEAVAPCAELWDTVFSLYQPRNPNNNVEEVVYPDLPPSQRKAHSVYKTEVEELQGILGLLSAERATNYKTWLDVGLALKQHFQDLPDGLNLFVDFSMKSLKWGYAGHTERAVEEAYGRFVPNGNLKVGSLYYWAKQDNLDGYRDLMGGRLTWDKLANLAQNEMAQYYASSVPQEYIYSGGCWYVYTSCNTLKKFVGSEYPPCLRTNISKVLQEDANALLKKVDHADEKYAQRLKTAMTCHKTFGSSQWINGVIDFLKAQYRDDDLSKKIDTNMNLLAFSNGLLFDYTIKTIRPIRRDDFVMRTTQKPIATTSDPAIKEYLMKELKNIFNTDEMVRYWLETIAMTCFTNKYERLYCHTGSGGNGKGVLFGLIKDAMGDYYYQAGNEFLTTHYKSDAPNSTLANAQRCRFFVTSEPSSENTEGKTMKLSTDLIKALTGGDIAPARDLYEKATQDKQIKPSFTAFLQCNAIPPMTKVDGGIRRRFEKLDYPNKYVEHPDPNRPRQKKIDYDLKEKLAKPEIVNEFVLLLLDVAINFTGFHRPESVVKASKEHLDSNDQVLSWLGDQVQILDEAPPKADRITKAQAYERFKADTQVRISAQKFHEQMKTNEVEVKKIGVEFYLLRWLTDQEKEARQAKAEAEAQ